ncbi:MAG: ABC transporter ATP-binding protein [Candidatus Rokubacteria bacterium 13_1_40CM_68_15]|nr:MAG: ABC transporter ATP-binding protein [Candidatus Rokubacteria bacterium 13_1_40CM_68_15]
MLQVDNVEASYGLFRALSGVTLEIRAGEIVALLGPNGAGKTTLIRCIAGLLRPRAGRILWDGASLAKVAAHRIVERGIAVVPEGRRLFATMTVEEHLDLGAFAPHARAARPQRLEEVYAIFPVLRERRRQLVRSLSGGQQQMVAVGRALMAAPRLLILDEPSLGLAPRIVESILGVLGEINRRGVSILLVEQNVHAALALAHRGYILESGRMAGEGTGAALMDDPHVKRAYLGPLALRR